MKTLMTWAAAALLILGLFAPAVSMADEDKPHLCFRTLDADGDGKVTLEEFKDGYPRLDQDKFQELDKDKNGTLNHDEYHDALGHGSLD